MRAITGRINSVAGAACRSAHSSRRRPDLDALLDVTAPEPPAPDSPLYSLPNVILTPHLAGSLGPECERMGHAMADELERYLAGRPLQWEVTPLRAATMA